MQWLIALGVASAMLNEIYNIMLRCIINGYYNTWVSIIDLPCVMTTRKKSTLKIQLEEKADSATTIHELDKASTEDAYCNEQSCPNKLFRKNTEISDKG